MPDDAAAVALTVTAVDTAAAGFLTVWPADRPQPVASTIAWGGPDEVRANGTLVGLSVDGRISLFVNSPVHVVVDVAGAFVSAIDRHRRPVRADDTDSVARHPRHRSTCRGRHGARRAARGSRRRRDRRGDHHHHHRCERAGLLHRLRRRSDRPTASVLNTVRAGQTVAATAIVPVDDEGVAVFTQRGDHVIVDLNGWFTGDSADPTDEGLFVPITPTRTLDTRTAGIPLYTGGTLSMGAAAAVGDGAAAVVANLTSVESLGDGFVTAYPSSTERPLASTAELRPRRDGGEHGRRRHVDRGRIGVRQPADATRRRRHGLVHRYAARGVGSRPSRTLRRRWPAARPPNGPRSPTRHSSGSGCAATACR